jgi:hypothetical protein
MLRNHPRRMVRPSAAMRRGAVSQVSAGALQSQDWR